MDRGKIVSLERMNWIDIINKNNVVVMMIKGKDAAVEALGSRQVTRRK